MSYKKQYGVGMIEVLVALLLLAIGVLGFTALQLRAVDATSEALNRVQGMALARDLTERIRANPNGYANYKNNLNATTQLATAATPCLQTTAVVPACTTAAHMAAEDTAEVVTKANALGMKIKMPTCFGVNNGRACIYVAWNKTNATNGTDSADCTESSGGSYNPQSSCVVMEAY